MAERQDQGRAGHHHHQAEGGTVADQLVYDQRTVGRGVKDEDPRADQGLGDPPVERPVRPASGELAEREQEQPEQGRHPHLHRRGDEADLDRVADEQHAGDGERDPADPDHQSAADPALEEAAESLVRRRGRVPFGFGFGVRFRVRLRLRPIEMIEPGARRCPGRNPGRTNGGPGFENGIGGRRRRRDVELLHLPLEILHPPRQLQREDEDPGQGEKENELHRCDANGPPALCQRSFSGLGWQQSIYPLCCS
jgi:hypothetical protein